MTIFFKILTSKQIVEKNSFKPPTCFRQLQSGMRDLNFR